MLKKELAKIKDVREQFKLIKEELKATNQAKQEDYMKLNEIKRALEQQVREKDLTIEQLKENIEDFRNNNQILQPKDDDVQEVKQTSHLSKFVNNYQEHLSSQSNDEVSGKRKKRKLKH